MDEVERNGAQELGRETSTGGTAETQRTTTGRSATAESGTDGTTTEERATDRDRVTTEGGATDRVTTKGATGATKPDRPAKPRQTDPYVVQSVDNAVRLLFELAEVPAGGSLGVTDLSRALSFTKNATFRLLKTLERHRLVVQDENRRYRLGAGVLALSANVQAGLSLVEVSKPILNRLLEATGESVHLAAREDLEAVIVDSLESSHAVRLTAEIGGRYPLHVGACPQAILAALPTGMQERVFEQLAELPTYTRQTPVDEAELRRRIQQVQLRGYSVSDEDVDAGARGVGAAILDADGMPLGAVSVGGPTYRISPERLHEYGRLVAEAAAEISSRLGARPRS